MLIKCYKQIKNTYVICLLLFTIVNNHCVHSQKPTDARLSRKTKSTDVLVGGFNPSEKYYSVGIMIPNIWKVIKMFQTTKQCFFI